ncbi:nitroreductase family protein [uncultured Alistipes sp.]|uniref:nitroreductase family protein n=1 Tax=uncultured Alistipes sp. TaxID=538949 RepID=UPI00272B9868|nr:nitroreductase family protein [uncultured Alistipes sp.]
MADNYLGRKMEEYFTRPNRRDTRRPARTLEQLLLKNRSHRGYDARFAVREDQLRSIIGVNARIPSARNQQVLRFRPVLAAEASKVLGHIRLGGALPEMRLPLPGTEPNAFIIICSTVEESRYVDIDLGISAQSMLLRAVEMGLNGICIGAFDKEAIRREFDLPYDPLLILAVGRGIERIELDEIGENQSLAYYRDEQGTHHVPKLRTESLILE